MKEHDDAILDLTNQKSSHEIHMEEIFKQIYSKDDIELKTELSQRQVNALTKGHLFGSEYKCDLMKDLCNWHEKLLVSKARGGRKEFVEVAKSTQAIDDLQNKKMKERLLGL